MDKTEFEKWFDNLDDARWGNGRKVVKNCAFAIQKGDDFYKAMETAFNEGWEISRMRLPDLG